MLTTLSSKKERLTRAGSETTRTSPRIVPTCGRENILIKAAVYDSQGYPRLMRRTESRRCHGGEGTRFNNVRGRGNPELQILCRLLLCSSAFPARQDQAYRTDHYVRTSFFSSLTDPAERPGDSDSLSCWARHQERRRQALPRWLVQVDPPTSKLSLPRLHCDDEPVSLLDESMGGGAGWTTCSQLQRAAGWEGRGSVVCTEYLFSARPQERGVSGQYMRPDQGEPIVREPIADSSVLFQRSDPRVFSPTWEVEYPLLLFIDHGGVDYVVP